MRIQCKYLVRKQTGGHPLDLEEGDVCQGRIQSRILQDGGRRHGSKQEQIKADKEQTRAGSCEMVAAVTRRPKQTRVNKRRQELTRADKR